MVYTEKKGKNYVNKSEGLIEIKKATLFKYSIYLIVLILFVSVLFGSFYQISAGERGVLLTFGKADSETKGEGLHFKIPFVQIVKKLDIKTQKYEADLTAASRDLQDVNTKIAINYHLVGERVPEVYTNIGIDYAEKVIHPLEQETNKAITAQYTAEELITKREEVRQKMKESLAEKLQPRGIIVEEISIVNFAFSSSFTQAIEQKVTAEQLKLKAERDLERIKIEAEQKVTQAKAEADSITIQSQALKQNPDILKLRAIEKWDGVLPKVTSGAIPFVPINELD